MTWMKNCAGAPLIAASAPWNHYFQQQISSAMWADIEAQMAVWGDPNSDAQSRIAAIPTVGDVILNNPTQTEITNALAANNVVQVAGTGVLTSQGTYLVVAAGKTLIGVPGQETALDCTAQNYHWSIILQTGARLAHFNIIGQNNPSPTYSGIAVNVFGNHIDVFKVQVRDSYGIGSTGIIMVGDEGSAPRSYNNIIVSCEVLRCADNNAGGDTDGFSNTYEANDNTFIDCHAREVTDDGFDFWHGKPVHAYYCTSQRIGKHPTRPNAGGSGWKFGAQPTAGSNQHRLYKCNASDNKTWDWNWNSNVGPHYLISCTQGSPASGSGEYAFGASDAPGGASPKYKLSYP